MKIKKIYISNYKSYDDTGVHVDFNNITGFIGANSTGKSNILKAIDLFFNTPKVNEFDFHNKNTEKDIIIDITFSEYGDIKNAEEALLINSNEITLRRVIRWNAVKSQAEPEKQLIPVHIWEYKGNVSELDLFPEARLNMSRLRAFNSSDAGKDFYSLLNNDRVIENVNDYYEALGQYWVLNYKNNSWNENYLFTEFQYNNKYKSLVSYVNTNIVEKLPEYIYLPIEQTISEELVSKRGTRLEYIFSKLLQYSDSENKKRKKELNAIEEKIERYYKRFYDRKINNLNNSLNNIDTSFGFSDAKLSVQREVLNVDEILEPTIKLMADDGFVSEITTKGTGAQRWAVFQFLQTYADYISKSKNINIILAIDEPELYLHPPYKRAMYDTFRKLKKTFQIIYTTHDPIFVSLEYFDEIRIIRKSDGINSCINYVDWHKLSRFSEIIPAFKATQSEKSKRQELFNKCHSEQNEGFFASKIILVEGNTEIYALPIYFKALGFDINQKNISLIPGDGIESLKILYAIFTLFGIPTYVIFDGDKPAILKEREAFYKIYPMSKKQYANILSLLESHEETNSNEILDKLKKKKEIICKIFSENDYKSFIDGKCTLKDIITLSAEKYNEYCAKNSRNIPIHKMFDTKQLEDGFSEFGIYKKYTKWEFNFEEDVSKKLDNYSKLLDDAKKDVSGKPLIAKQIALNATRKGLSRNFKTIMQNLINKINSLSIPGDIPEISSDKVLTNKFKIVLLPFGELEEKICDGKTEYDKYNIYSCAGGPINPGADDYINQAYGILPDNTKYIIKITGESMEPDIPDNSYLAIEECVNPINNKIYVFYYDGQSICKLYNKGSDGKIRLISLNSSVPPIEVDQDPICYGKVICGNDKKPVFLGVVDRLEQNEM